MQNLQYILQKYWDIIKEEVNVKEISSFDEDLNIQKQYVPEWRIISTKFGKDTWSIIKYAKMWNVEELEDGKIKVFGDGKEWILENTDYQVRYQWDIDEKSMAIEEGIVVGLDLNIDEELKNEWIVREISRFVNQLRKQAGYDVSDRVYMFWSSDSKDYFEKLFIQYWDFLKQEALLKDIKFGSDIQDCDVKEQIELDSGDKLEICLKKDI